MEVQKSAVGWFVDQLAKKYNEFQALTFYYDHREEIIQAKRMEQILLDQVKHELSNTDMQLDEAFYEGVEYAGKQMYSEDRVKELLAIQRGNCYVAVLTKCKDYEIAEVAVEAPEPWDWNNKICK